VSQFVLRSGFRFPDFRLEQSNSPFFSSSVRGLLLILRSTISETRRCRIRCVLPYVRAYIGRTHTGRCKWGRRRLITPAYQRMDPSIDPTWRAYPFLTGGGAPWGSSVAAPRFHPPSTPPRRAGCYRFLEQVFSPLLRVNSLFPEHSFRFT
jgi:hypothetical protein